MTSADLPDIPILETAQLRLRAFSDEDLDEYARICANPDFMRFLSAGRPLSREEAYDQLLFIWAHWRAHSYGLWAVEEKCSGHLMGRVGFQYADEWGGVQIGWAIAPQFWGQGHATQASRQAIDWLFSERDIQKLLCLVLPENTRSIAMAARLGMGYSHDMSYQGKKVYVYSLNAPGGA